MILNNSNNLFAGILKNRISRVILNNMAFLNTCRIVVQILAICFLFLATILLLAALFTPHWQKLDLSPADVNGEQVYHYHGLWSDCVYSSASDNSNGGLICTHKAYDNQEDLPPVSSGDIHPTTQCKQYAAFIVTRHSRIVFI